MKKTRVMIVDDHSVVRMGLSAIINLEKDLKVCGEAESGQDAVRLAKELRPDVVVMDFMMPGMDGKPVRHGGGCGSFFQAFRILQSLPAWAILSLS